jgi:hypothetical protein
MLWGEMVKVRVSNEHRVDTHQTDASPFCLTGAGRTKIDE